MNKDLHYCGRVPELDEAGKTALRDKARRNGGKHHEIYGYMSDEWVADRVRMLMRTDIDHEAICQAARDRIMRLVLRQEALVQALRDARDTMFAHGIGNWELCEELVGPAFDDAELAAKLKGAFGKAAPGFQAEMKRARDAISNVIIPPAEGTDDG